MTAEVSEPAAKPNALRRHWRAFLVFALLVIPGATLVPVGQSDWTYQWYFDDWPVGEELVQITGSTQHVARRYGLPGGTLQFGTNVSTAFYTLSGVETQLPMTDTLEARIRRAAPEAYGPEGWGLNLGGVFPPPPVLVLGVYVFCCLWWTALRRWSWSESEPLKRNLTQVLLLSVWPWLLMTSCGFVILDMRAAAQLSEPIVDPELSIAGTALLVSVGAVFALTRSGFRGSALAAEG